jgi:hypothetical protein
MRAKLILIFTLTAFIFPSCRNSDQGTNPVEKVNLTMEIVSCSDVPAELDTNLSYSKSFVEWNTTTNWHDTTKADSLALWFLQSQYKITDMWYPESGNICLYPINTDNLVTIRLAEADTSLKSQGYNSTSRVGTGCCYPTYRHYKYARIKSVN